MLLSGKGEIAKLPIKQGKTTITYETILTLHKPQKRINVSHSFESRLIDFIFNWLMI